MHEVSNEVRGVETDKEPAQFSDVSDQVVGVELKALSMPANLPIHSKVTIAIDSNSQSTSSPLAGIISAPAEPTSMEEIPSPIMVSKTNLEVGDNSLAFTPTHDSLSHNHTEQPNVQDDEDGLMSDAMANLNTSRGGRPIKPLQKYQDMDWNTIRGKGFLITWLVTKPKKLHYSLENASVQNFNLTDDNHMSATFKLTIQSHNPNHRISVYYNSVEIYVKFKDQTLAFDTMEPFHQPRMNVTQIDDTLVAQNVAVSKSSGKDLRDQHSLGKIELEVYVKAKVRFKVAVWKSSHRTAHIKCSHATVYLSQSNKSLNSSCDADI
ncbi:hypothetical protein F2Q69_00019200 [Brassica cretica]|uniref:Late embryogenesis abundant protein LEA-2 subgroup domain-containing protein n=1 Tax=Brassica cretica TaxID=69181 RepID=A0A8S9QJH6_BRACR|nr:hypothetical protein F2Q69_00019200 [Brassica cretica]